MNNSPLPHTRDESVNTENKNATKDINQYSLFIALGFLFLIVLITGYYYWENHQAQTVIKKIQSEKEEYDSKIQVLKSNPDVLAAEILLTKEEELSKIIKESNPAIYIRELERIYESSGITFEGFSYSKGKVSTRLIAQSGSDEDAVKKVITLIAEYRNSESITGNKLQNSTNSGEITSQKSPSLFSLGPVLSVSGDKGERSVNIEFTIQ